MTNHMGGGAHTKKCFSGYNYYVLGWHQGQTNEIATLTANSARRYNLKSIADLATGGIVNIKVDKYFVTLNLKKGINSETGEYANQVVIHEGKDIHFGQTISAAYYDTKLVANLETQGDKFNVASGSGNLRIELCSMDTVGSVGAMLSIGLDATDCQADGVVLKPSGMQTLISGVPISGLQGNKNDVLEFKMEFSQTPDSVTCSTSGGTGDVDLIVNSMSSPQVSYTSQVNSCYSRGSTTTQSCTTTELKGRFVYILVEGDEPFNGVKLECTATGGGTSIGNPGQGNNQGQGNNEGQGTNEGPGRGGKNEENDQEEETPEADGTVLRSGVPKNNIKLAVGTSAHYTLPMPSNAKSVSCFISGGVGDADLYTRWDAKVDVDNRSVNDCVPWINGSEETCDGSRLTPLGKVLNVGIYAYKAVEGVALECDITTK